MQVRTHILRFKIKRIHTKNGLVSEKVAVSVHQSRIFDCYFAHRWYTSGMMNIQELLSEFKRQNNLTNDYIANYCGVTKSTVSRWCSGRIRRITPETLAKLSEMFQVDLDDMTRVGSYNYEKPILGTVKAGYGLLADENLEGYIQVSEKDFHDGDYFLRVTGNSMKDANIHDGDLLFVKQCTDIPSGSIGVFLIGGEEVTVKKLIKKDNYWILQAANPDVEPKVFTFEELESTPVQIIGRALYARTDLA